MMGIILQVSVSYGFMALSMFIPYRIGILGFTLAIQLQSGMIFDPSISCCRLIIAAAVCDGLDGHVARRGLMLGKALGKVFFKGIKGDPKVTMGFNVSICFNTKSWSFMTTG